MWELVIKSGLGKLIIPDDLDDVVSKSGFHYIPVEAAHAWLVRTLPAHHRDPFDRLLMAQALSVGATLVSRDSEVLRYSVPILTA